MKNNPEKAQFEAFGRRGQKPPEEPEKKETQIEADLSAEALAKEGKTISLAREAEEAFSRNDFDAALLKLRELQRITSKEEEKEHIDTNAITATLEKLLKEGASKNDVARGLAGVGTVEAMALREKLLKEGANKSYVAYGLAGVGTVEAMALREKLLKEGASKSDVAWGLAGVLAEDAMEFRKRHFGDNPTLFAKSFSTGWSTIDGVVCQYGYEK